MFIFLWLIVRYIHYTYSITPNPYESTSPVLVMHAMHCMVLHRVTLANGWCASYRQYEDANLSTNARHSPAFNLKWYSTAVQHANSLCDSGLLLISKLTDKSRRHAVKFAKHIGICFFHSGKIKKCASHTVCSSFIMRSILSMIPKSLVRVAWVQNVAKIFSLLNVPNGAYVYIFANFTAWRLAL